MHSLESINNSENKKKLFWTINKSSPTQDWANVWLNIHIQLGYAQKTMKQNNCWIKIIVCSNLSSCEIKIWRVSSYYASTMEKAQPTFWNYPALKTFLLPCLTLIPLIIILIEWGWKKNSSASFWGKTRRRERKWYQIYLLIWLW